MHLCTVGAPTGNGDGEDRDHSQRHSTRWGSLLAREVPVGEQNHPLIDEIPVGDQALLPS